MIKYTDIPECIGLQRVLRTYSINISSINEGYKIAHNVTHNIHKMTDEIGGSIEAEIRILLNPVMNTNIVNLLLEIEKRPIENLEKFAPLYDDFYDNLNTLHKNLCIFIKIKGLINDYDAISDEDYNKFAASIKLNNEVNSFIIDYLENPSAKKYKIKTNNSKSKSPTASLYVDPYDDYNNPAFDDEFLSAFPLLNIRHIKASVPIDYLNKVNKEIEEHKANLFYNESPKNFSLSNKFIVIVPPKESDE